MSRLRTSVVLLAIVGLLASLPGCAWLDEMLKPPAPAQPRGVALPPVPPQQPPMPKPNPPARMGALKPGDQKAPPPNQGGGARMLPGFNLGHGQPKAGVQGISNQPDPAKKQGGVKPVAAVGPSPKKGGGSDVIHQPVGPGVSILPRINLKPAPPKPTPGQPAVSAAKKLGLSPGFLTTLRRTKRKADMARLRQTYTLRNGIPFISTKSRLRPMMTLAVLEQPLPPANRAHAQRYPANVARYRGYFNGPRRDPRAPMPGSTCDNLWRYTPVHDEYERSTAVVHAILAAMEGFPYVWNDLSEEYAHHLCITRLRGSCRQNLDLRATYAAAILTDGVCPEHLWPYTRTPSKLPVRHAAPPAAIAQARYRIADSRFVEDFGEEGASIRNPRYLEAALDCNYAIVCSMYACWDENDNHGTLDVLLDPATGDPVHPDVTRAGHCMLLVGYDRGQQHFIARNCWGQEWGHNGYAHISYDYLATYARHGFYILGVAGNPNPGRVLPVYRDAPYAKKPIRITQGSHKIIFARTERGNYARFELVAGRSHELVSGHSHVQLREIHTARPDAIPLLCTPAAYLILGRYLDLEAGRDSTHSSFVDLGVSLVRQGQFDLVPQNGAGLHELLDVSAIAFKDVKATRMDDDEIPAYHLGGSVVLVKTESGRYARCVVHAMPGELVFSHIIVWNSDGKVHRSRLGWRLPRTGSMDIDLDDIERRSGPASDLRWVKSTNPARPDHLTALPRSLLKLHTRVPPLY